MEVKKPFADEIPDILHSQDILIEHGDPLGTATGNQFLDGFRTFQMKWLQAQQADVAGSFHGVFQGTAVDIPTHSA